MPDDFPDTIIAPRRQPMPFEPASYRAAMCKADACRQGREPCATPDACRLASEDAEDSEFGALEGLARGGRYIVAAWAFIAAVAGAAYLIWWR